MTNECRQQFTLRITQANSTELVVILYEMMLSYLEDAEAALRDGDESALVESVRKSRACLNELERSLHMEYELSGHLMRLYFYCAKRLVHVRSREAQAIDDIRKVIRPLHDAYAKIAPQNPGGPVMGNSQTVYAGLTYGRSSLTENMADQGADRGMRV